MSILETTRSDNTPSSPSPNGKDQLGRYWSDLEERVREQPNQYLAIALVAGFLLQVLPIRSLLGLIIRLLAVLIKPALVVVAFANFARLLADRQQPKSLIVTPNSPPSGT